MTTEDWKCSPPCTTPVAHGLDLGAAPDDADPVRAEKGQHPLDGQLVLEDLGRLAHLRPALRLRSGEWRCRDVLDEPFREARSEPAAAEASSVSTSWNFTDELPQLRTTPSYAHILPSGAGNALNLLQSLQFLGARRQGTPEAVGRDLNS